MKYKSKRRMVDATRWWGNGDHPDDYPENKEYTYTDNDGFGPLDEIHRRKNKYEGEVVRYFIRPDVESYSCCPYCGHRLNRHGWIDVPYHGRIACPGDWIITINGQHYPCKDEIFKVMYKECVN